MLFAPALLSLALTQPVQTPATDKAAPTQPPAPQPAPAAAAPEPRREATPEVILTLKDGSVFQGLLTKKDEKKYVLEIAGVPATFAAEKVSTCNELRPVLERYKELREAAAPSDVDQRITLIRWLADRRQIEIALAEAELLSAKNPKHVGVQKLLDDLRVRADLLQKPAETPGDSTSDPSVPADPAGIPPGEFPFLTDEQIRLIKVYEVDLNARPRVIFPRDAISHMLEQYASSPLTPTSREGKDAILRQDPIETVQLMFRLRAREYYDKVRIVDQPESMRRFRDDVQRVTLINGCATSQCHGGRDAGRFVLSNFRANTDTTVYTNFYILTSFRTKSGQPLIDWDKPEQSLFLQMALPRDLSRARHPLVMKDGKDVWRPALNALDDRRAFAITDWIKSAYRPRPDYTLDYTPYRPFSAPPPPPEPDPKKPPLLEPVIR